jgi:hypothetical protein
VEGFLERLTFISHQNYFFLKKRKEKKSKPLSNMPLSCINVCLVINSLRSHKKLKIRPMWYILITRSCYLSPVLNTCVMNQADRHDAMPT